MRSSSKQALRPFLIAFCLQAVLAAQPSTPKERPLIGLVLGGGSALGLAHVGVIRWFEENHIPIDRIAGTSMGGLVGGFYATGANGVEIEKFLKAVDWTAVLSPAPAFRDFAYRRKQDRREFPTRLEFGLKGGFRLPPALSAAQGIGLMLSRIAGSYVNLKSFDDLPTPFRCVATDLYESREVIFRYGDLYEALRATMSIPAVFDPVELNGHVLVDGGLLNNLPVDVAKTMGADIVIAVELDPTVEKPKHGVSVLQVLGRSVSTTVTSNERRSMRLADLVILPDIDGFASSDFAKVEELAARGYQAAAQKAALLKKFALSDSDWKTFEQARSARRKIEVFAPDDIKIEGIKGPLEEDLARHLAPAIQPPHDRDRAEYQITRVTGLGRWDSADYRLIDDKGFQTLDVRVHEKEHGPPFLNTVITIDGETSQPLRFGIGGRLTFLDVGNPGSEWRTDFTLGTSDTIQSEYFYRIRSRRVFLAPRISATQFNRDLYANNRQVASVKVRELNASTDLGFAIDRLSEFRSGFGISRYSNNVTIGFPSLPTIRTDVRNFHMSYIYEGQDSPIVATKGVRLATTAQWIFSSPLNTKQYPVFESDLRYARPLGSRFVFTSNIAGGATIGASNLYSPFTLGGPLRLAALAPFQYIGNNYYYANASLLRLVSPAQFSFVTRIYVGLIGEAGKAFNNSAQAAPFADGAIGVVGETPLGVLFFGGSYGEQGQRKLFFRLGRYF